MTTGKHATTEKPIFNYRGDKVAWIELKEDGHEVDRSVHEFLILRWYPLIFLAISARIVLYDLKMDIRHTLTQGWDRSAKEIAVSPSSYSRLLPISGMTLDSVSSPEMARLCISPQRIMLE